MMIRKIAAGAAAIAAMGLTTIGSPAQAHDHDCDNDRSHHNECPEPPPPVPVPSGFNVIIGSRHSDRLPGTDGRDAIFAFGGLRDVIIGGAGRDRLYGMRGHDVIRARDGERDVVNGGSGRDRCIVDPQDVVRNCETIIVV